MNQEFCAQVDYCHGEEDYSVNFQPPAAAARPDVRTSGRPDVWTSGLWDVWTSRLWDVWTSGRQDVWMSRRPDVCIDVRTSHFRTLVPVKGALRDVLEALA